MENFTIDSNISISDDHIGLDENQDYYDLENKNDTTQLNVTLDYCKVSREKYYYQNTINIPTGAPQDHTRVRPLHCHSLRHLLRLWSCLCILRVPLLQSHHVLVRVHLWFHRGLSHLCGGESAARYDY